MPKIQQKQTLVSRYPTQWRWFDVVPLHVQERLSPPVITRHLMTLCPPSRATLETVLKAIGEVVPPGRQRQDLASAVRQVAKALGKKPEEVPANPRLLSIRLKSVSPQALGYAPARWNNIRSLLRKALALVQPVMPGNSAVPLSPAWEVLFDMIKGKRAEGIRLSRLLRWLSEHQITPERVTLSHFERFRDELKGEALLKDPEATWRHAVWAWNRSVKQVEGWPAVPIEVTSRKEVYVLPWSVFPASMKQDVDGWLLRLSGTDLEADGSSRAVKPSTLATREYQLRSFASALVHRGIDPQTLTSLSACLSFENYKEGLRFFHERAGKKSTSTIHGMASMLKGVARHWVKADQKTLEGMSAVIRRLAVEEKGLTDKNRDRLRPLQDPKTLRTLLGLPRRLLHDAETGRAKAHRHAQLVETAVALEILLFAPIRIGNLVSLDIDRHLIQVGKKLHIVIPAGEVKNNVDLEFELLDESARLIAIYLEQYRTAPKTNRALFPGKVRDAKSLGTLRGQIKKVVHDYTGLEVNPHLFRHIGAQTYLTENPGGYEVVRRVLAHKSMATTTSSYTGLETRQAGLHFAKTIDACRTPAKPEAGR